MVYDMLQNLDNNVADKIDQALRQRIPGPMGGGSVSDQSPSYLPVGFATAYGALTREFARGAVLGDPMSVALVQDRRDSYVARFKEFVQRKSTRSDVTAHINQIDTDTVRRLAFRTRTVTCSPYALTRAAASRDSDRNRSQ